MESDDSWEEAVEERLELMPKKTSIQRAVDIKIVMIHKIIWFLRKMQIPVEKPMIEEKVDFHIDERLKEYVNSLKDIEEVDRVVMLFKLLILFGIPSRIYIVLGEEPKCFIESRLLGRIREHHGRYAGCVFSVDSCLRLKDQSYHFSKSTKQFSAARYVAEGLSKFGMDRKVSGGVDHFFDDLDKERMRKIPSSIEKMKRHPKFVVESMLRRDQCIYPKRPTFGLFRGEIIYSRENIVKLRTKEQFYKMGKDIGSSKPYRVVKKDEQETRLYAPWQTCDLVVEGFGESMYQDFFHPNFIPQGCVYINNKSARDVAYLLGFPYRICFQGFLKGMPINRGIFLEKRNLYVFSNFLFQYCRYLEMKEKNERGALGFKKWRFLIRNAAKYLKIRRGLGLK
ncbi:DNA repair protein Rad4 [Encephalitozoon intestinalis ATCC 50506]|uniref:DNA repair protein Rad4 n=1 Tax=Encephalitozoon intestinalis (strain ATCC 50506) TaxID=876142 RepID=E0S5B0_ENCIT|nr:DNA repair protein Rad4 [Encephalitozoon intestinalis ATCC 50506]ADM10895.1 DNA repair protein Rad4 [Encephalitozoon intestinalis ATCC 50506]UTX44527.1 DNA repair protein Rad4 [Encephalitozoon intestinalis]